MKFELETISGTHHGQPVLHSGAALENARAAMIMIHGRGASAADILSLASEFKQTELLYLAPQAEGCTWYPYSFLEPLERNQPALDSALSVIESLLDQLADANFPPEKIFLLGFSQGACLALEFAIRNPKRYAGIFGLSGGLIGPPGTTWPNSGTLSPTPVLLGCSDVDPHIPVWRIQETARELSNRGAEVTTRLYPGMGHTVNMDEINQIQQTVKFALEGSNERRTS